jgi:hypothetical protein
MAQDPLRIKCFNALKHWNNNPTEEKPIVLEWFMDWFFIEVLEKEKMALAVEAREEMIKFTMICEKMERDQAIERTDTNLDYYSNYSSNWHKLWNDLKERL